MQLSLNSLTFPFISITLLSHFLLLTLANNNQNFLECLSKTSDNSASISQVIYTQNNPSYESVLNFSALNRMFTTPTTPKPLAIITPLNVSHIQATINCSRKHGLEIRIRSGGHDFEGSSYVSNVPFVIIDMINLSSISVDAENRTAWVEAGATIGQLYYRIGEKNRTLAFPAGICPTVGVGGHFSGGGYGFMMRKFGLAADHLLDAHFIDANGELLNRESMGEDLFWAIRGGGGASFGVIVAWKISLVPVPSNVTLFQTIRTLEQNATKLVQRWQYVASNLHEDVFLAASWLRGNSSNEGRKTMQVLFVGLYLGGADELLPLIYHSFPELGLLREECFEMEWIQTAFFLGGFQFGQPLERLLDRNFTGVISFTKSKSDYVTEPIPEAAWEGILEKLAEEEVENTAMIMIPYGGRMSKIPAYEIPFPHRAGNLYKIRYEVSWMEEGIEASQRNLNWMRELYDHMTPYVSKNPRSAYVNYRDLDIGTNNEGFTSIKQARIWGEKYFKNNFNRLVRVKTMVDPTNFFRNEQSIPPLTSWWKNRG